jgi:hypothetical protein
MYSSCIFRNGKLYKKYTKLLNGIHTSAKAAKIQYSIGFGSLHAYAQTGDFCRWDDDHDVLLPYYIEKEQKQLFFDKLDNLGISVYENNGELGHTVPFKFFLKKNKEYIQVSGEKLPYSYPFVDGFYYHINQTTKEFILYALNEIVIPLPNDDTKIFRTKKFGDARVRVPFPYSFLNDTLNALYGDKWCMLCSVKGWNHKFESSRRGTVTVDCDQVLYKHQLKCLDNYDIEDKYNISMTFNNNSYLHNIKKYSSKTKKNISDIWNDLDLEYGLINTTSSNHK